MQLPSNKVGLVFLIVVLVVVGTIATSNLPARKAALDLQNVNLLVARNTDASLKSGDQDNDGLPDWLEEFYHSDPKNPDTDGDGTNDGDEVTLKRDPTVAGPNDPLLTSDDFIDYEAGSSTPGTITSQTSIELFTQYMMLKQKGQLTSDDGAKLVDDLARKAASEASLKDNYALSNLRITATTQVSLEAYGDRLAQLTLGLYQNLDSYKSLEGSAYFNSLSKEYAAFAQTLTEISVPVATQDLHLMLANYAHKSSALYAALAQSEADPMVGLVAVQQFQAATVTDGQLYTSLGDYFKNNGILFETESTTRFWNAMSSK